MKRRLSALLCALTLALSLSGCWSGDVSDDSSGDFWEETPPVEADTSSTLTPITSFALPYLQGVTLDPITCPDGMQQTLGALLYEGLLVLDESFAPQNVLCSRYEHNDDCTSYTFYLRDGVSFSDGSILTASDVLATLRRAQESERYSARFANVASMRASNGALIVNLTRADSTFPALLDIPIVKSGSEKNTVPLGTGPYLFVTDSDGACLKQNPDWRSDGTLPFERIELRAVKDADTASYLFSSREVHLLSADLTSSTGDLRSADTALTDYATANMIYLGFNTQRAPLSDASLRSALAGAIDRATITTGYLAGHAEAARFPLSPHSSLYPTEMASTLASPDLAAALESAGVTESRPRTVTILVSESDSFKVSIADYLSRTLSTDVLTVSVRSLPWSDYLTALNIWDRIFQADGEPSNNALRRICKSEYFSWLRVRQWKDLVNQLTEMCRELKFKVGSPQPASRPDLAVRQLPINQQAAHSLCCSWDDRGIHTSMLSGLLSMMGMQIVREPKASDFAGLKGAAKAKAIKRAQKMAKNDYQGARGTHFALFPASAVAKSTPQWVMSTELVETSRLWARYSAAIDPAWAEPLAGQLTRTTYAEPHWSGSRGSAVATAKVLL